MQPPSWHIKPLPLLASVSCVQNTAHNTHLGLLFQLVGGYEPLPHRHFQQAETALDIYAEMPGHLTRKRNSIAAGRW